MLLNKRVCSIVLLYSLSFNVGCGSRSLDVANGATPGGTPTTQNPTPTTKTNPTGTNTNTTNPNSTTTTTPATGNQSGNPPAVIVVPVVAAAVTPTPTPVPVVVTPPPPPCGKLLVDGVLASGKTLASCNGAHVLTMQADGNLVLYSPVGLAYATGTVSAGAFLKMQGDGNLVLFSAAGAPLWSTRTAGHPGATLTVQNNGDLAISNGGTALWTSGTNDMTHGCGIMGAGVGLAVNQRLQSCNGLHRLAMQANGIAAVWSPVGPVWYQPTNNATSIHMQTDGNFVLYAVGTPLWASNTGGRPGAILAMQDDGNLVVYHNNAVAWASNTSNMPYSCGGLPAGKSLAVNQRIQSCDGGEVLLMQDNGYLGLWGPVGLLWHSSAVGTIAHMQTDGNLVLYVGNTPTWSSGTHGHAGAILALQNDGNLVVYSGNQAIWHTHTNDMTRACGVMGANQILSPNQRLASCDGRYALYLQGDGNLVLYAHGRGATWASNTRNGVSAIMQGDGNFVVYNTVNASWNSQTWNRPGAVLAMQSDGNLVIYHGSAAVWATNTR